MTVTVQANSHTLAHMRWVMAQSRKATFQAGALPFSCIQSG